MQAQKKKEILFIIRGKIGIACFSEIKYQNEKKEYKKTATTLGAGHTLVLAQIVAPKRWVVEGRMGMVLLISYKTMFTRTYLEFGTRARAANNKCAENIFQPLMKL